MTQHVEEYMMEDIKMDVQQVLQELDALYASGDFSKIEPFLKTKTVQAEREGDWQTQIMLQNETMGLYRELGRTKEALLLFNQTRLLFGEHGLVGTVPFASTLQNGANAYRADGQLEQAAFLYEEALEIYRRELPENDYRFAGLYNNLSLVYMEQGKNIPAQENLEKALSIIETLPDTTVEQATTHTNLADLYCQTDDLEKANAHLQAGLALFQSIDCEDPHFAALLSAWGQIHFKEGHLDQAYETYRRALTEIERYYGKNRSYAIVCRNCAAVLSAQGKEKEAETMRQIAKEILESLKK